MAALLKPVTNQHCRYRKKSKRSQSAHSISSRSPLSYISYRCWYRSFAGVRLTPGVPRRNFIPLL
jgi:hypothetical protein